MIPWYTVVQPYAAGCRIIDAASPLPSYYHYYVLLLSRVFSGVLAIIPRVTNCMIVCRRLSEIVEYDCITAIVVYTHYMRRSLATSPYSIPRQCIPVYQVCAKDFHVCVVFKKAAGLKYITPEYKK